MLCIVADTGIGCNLEEFQILRCPREFNGAKIWGQYIISNLGIRLLIR